MKFTSSFEIKEVMPVDPETKTPRYVSHRRRNIWLAGDQLG
jgi:hypothetical protein